jgi:hypothetical protein
MKNLIAIFVSLSLALMIGCQENLINEPESAALSKDKAASQKSIKICCEVKDLTYGICTLNGCVNYFFEVINNKMGPRKITEISLNIYMNSVLCDKLGMVHLEWRAEGRSSEIVTVSEEGILLLEKTYSITNRPDVVLLVKYLVTTNGVGIASVNVVRLEN